jgi:Mn2+/Fe2+ NRAMP family transporter
MRRCRSRVLARFSGARRPTFAAADAGIAAITAAAGVLGACVGGGATYLSQRSAQRSAQRSELISALTALMVLGNPRAHRLAILGDAPIDSEACALRQKRKTDAG